MQFGDAEREYRNLKAQFTAGQLSEADFRARLEEMMIEDSEGKWWSIGYETGKWYYYDGEKWARGDPPAGKSATTAAAASGAAAEPSGGAPGNLAAAGTLGAAAAATPPAIPAPAVAPAAGSGDASAAASGVTAGATAQAVAPARPKRTLTAAITAIVLLVIVAGVIAVLSQRFMVMSKEDMANMGTPTAATGSGQAGGMATVPAAASQVSPTVEAMAAMPAATSTPADTLSPTSVPPTDTATPQPASTPSATSELPTAAPTASPVPDTPTSEPPTPTPKPPTPTPAPTATKRPAPAPTQAPAASQPIAPASPGLVTGFEQFGGWKIGNQPYGTFAQSMQEAHSGSASARLDYNFPAVNDNYVVFSARPPLPIPGTPTALSVWVLGDGSGHFLNVWVQDSQGEVRAFPFGNVPAAGTWHQLTASLDTTAPWPQAHISGPDNGKLDYPIKLLALVLDGVPDGTASQGTIYLDDIMTARASNAATGSEPTPAP